MKSILKKIIKHFFIFFLLNSSIVLSQEPKYNIIKEISTMEEIHEEIFAESKNNINNIEKEDEVIDENIQINDSEDKTNIVGQQDIQHSPDLSSKNSSLIIDERKEHLLSTQKKEKINENKINKNKKYEDREKTKKQNRFEEINDRSNRVTALGSAMGAIDLGSTPAKKIRLGAGVGNSSSSQAVAVGVGYAPTDRLKLNTKFSSSTNNMNNNSISVGASYDLDL